MNQQQQQQQRPHRAGLRPALLGAVALLAFAAGAAQAQNLKPGLWEINQKMGGNAKTEQAMAQARQQMASMPPEQRKMMEEMMARHGVQMGAGGPGAMSVKVCMSKEMVEKNQLPTQRGDCKITRQDRSGNTMKVAFQCAQPPSSGEGEYTFASPEAYSMKLNVTTTMQGKPESTTIEGAGKWLGADCGNLKPLDSGAR